MNKYLYLLLVTLFPVLALAANDQTLDGANISVGGSTFVASGNADQLSVYSDNFVITLSPGGSVTVTSSDKKILTNTLNRKTTCGTNSSSVTLDWPSGESSAFEVTVTPSSTSCTANEGGGTISVGGSSSGGGGSAASTSVSQAVQAVASTPAPTVSQSQTSVIILFARDLRFGTSGTDVQKLQELLASDPILYPEGIISGYYGPATTRAVRAFQTKYGLSAVGRVGPQTRAKLNEVFGQPVQVTPTTPSSSNADQLKMLQDQLKALQDQLKALKK